MLKKIIILPAFFFLVHVGYIGCCKCADAGDGDYGKSTFLRINLIDTKTRNFIQTNGVSTADTIILEPQFTYECVAKNKNPFAGFVNIAYAFRCDCFECGYKGLKNKVTALEITSDSAYNGYLPGQNLAPLFKVQSRYGNRNIFITIDSAINEFNKESGAALSGFEFYISTKPTGPKGHFFTMKYRFTDNSIIQSSSNRFFWN